MSSDYDYPGETLQDAEDEDARPVGAFPNPDLSLCPVVPLGYSGPHLHFAMPEGEVRKELASKIGSMLKTDIFACQAGQSFLTHWRDAEDKFLRDLATVWFVRKCRAAGLWDTSRPWRSLGVWPGPDDAVVLHKGDEVWTFEADGTVSQRPIIDLLRDARSGPLYRLRPPAPSPGKPSSVADGAWARQQLDIWRFEAIGDEGLTGADVALGWTGAGILGGYAPFRGHLLVSALPGSGKSTLVEFIHGLQSAVAGDIIDAFTEAGLRNDLAGMARPVHIDEAEAAPGSQGPGPIERALEVLRRMSTGQGGTRKQGDVGGGSTTQTAVGAVLLAGVSPPRLGPADATRIVELRLMPLLTPGGAEKVATDAEVKGAIERARSLAPSLLRRALDGARRYRADVEAVKAALARVGETPRTADLVAMLAAGRRLLMADDPLSPAEAEEEVRFWRPLLVQRASTEVVSNEGADALAHLMAADSGQHYHDHRASIGELIERWLDADKNYEDVLKAHGLRMYPGDEKRPGPWLIVANHHPALERIFKGTKWPDWRRALAYLDALGADYQTFPTEKPLRFGMGVKQRGIAVPLTPWSKKAARPVSGVQPTASSDGGDLDW